MNVHGRVARGCARGMRGAPAKSRSAAPKTRIGCPGERAKRGGVFLAPATSRALEVR
jgi:hypothetical protein